MLDVNFCPECNVPEPFYQQHEWLNNGDVVRSASHQASMGIIECEALDPLFTNIGEIIGMSIYPLIINVTARGSILGAACQPWWAGNTPSLTRRYRRGSTKSHGPSRVRADGPCLHRAGR